MGSATSRAGVRHAVDTVVLVKVVPDVDALRFDPSTGTARRDGLDLFLNPFDQRALRVALDLRRPGESVRVVSMGPIAAERALHETRALGADRAVLLTDPALAGSDTLVTARVLARAVERLGAELVLTGRWTTDSETGQLPPQLAELLDRPFVPAARRIARTVEGELEIDSDTEDGWRSQRVGLPAVVSVGEKIAKIRKLLPDEVRASLDLPVERWSVSDLGIAPGSVGLAASPTFVVRLTDEAPHRTPRIFGDGSNAERVERAVGAVSLLLESAPIAGPGSRGHRDVAPNDRGRFLVLASGSDGAAAAPARDIVSAVHRDPAGWNAEAVWVGSVPPDADLRSLQSVGARRAWVARDPSAAVEPETVATVLGAVARIGTEPVGVAVLSDLFGRSVAGRLSAHEGWGLTGDAIGILRGDDGRPHYRKPAFGGRWVAEIGTRSGPALVTIRPGALPRAAPAAGELLPIEMLSAPARSRRVLPIASGIERDERWGDPGSAPVLWIVGQGVGGPEAVVALRDIARGLGAALGATRRVVDLGWAPRQVQVGLTGLSADPTLAVLIGVGGSANHLVGLHRARVLLAVNRDPAAPVFAGADVGIVGEWQEVVPLLVPALSVTVARIRERAR